MGAIRFPFSAIIGQDELMLGLMLNIVNPKLGGILIKGTKGTGKSTAVYALPDILPEIDINKNCAMQCDPEKTSEWCELCKSEYSEQNHSSNKKPVDIVSIPISVTEDSLLGTINIEKVLKEGKSEFIPGLLAKAHRQILYIDEVNLLPDFIVDDILDVSATGWNIIEREGCSIKHASKFLMVGTMNPEEGELRPQILDRFPLSVIVNSVKDKEKRSEIIRRNLMFEQNPLKFKELFIEKNEQIKASILLARKFLERVEIDSVYFEKVVQFCIENEIDGHRADIAIIKTAKTYAALELKENVDDRHIIQAALLVLRHRTREGGLKKPLTENEIRQIFQEIKIVKTGNSQIEINKDMENPGGELLKQEKKF